MLLCFRDWVRNINGQAVNSFLRASSVGKELKETWIVVNAATYFWNYNNHMITQNKHRDIYSQLQIILDGLKNAGHDGSDYVAFFLCLSALSLSPCACIVSTRTNTVA